MLFIRINPFKALVIFIDLIAIDSFTLICSLLLIYLSYSATRWKLFLMHSVLILVLECYNFCEWCVSRSKLFTCGYSWHRRLWRLHFVTWSILIHPVDENRYIYCSGGVCTHQYCESVFDVEIDRHVYEQTSSTSCCQSNAVRKGVFITLPLYWKHYESAWRLFLHKCLFSCGGCHKFNGYFFVKFLPKSTSIVELSVGSVLGRYVLT